MQRGNKNGLFKRVKGADASTRYCGSIKKDFKVQAKIALRKSDELAVKEQEEEMRTDQRFLDEISEAREEGKIDLTPWEIGFLFENTMSVEQTLLRGRELSKRTRETLDKIHSKIDRGGMGW